MATTRSEKARLRNGSTASLQGGEFIPREYHRRILKKIAQLTKVGAAKGMLHDILACPDFKTCIVRWCT